MGVLERKIYLVPFIDLHELDDPSLQDRAIELIRSSRLIQEIRKCCLFNFHFMMVWTFYGAVIL